jgi:uncharacterized protein YecT (DUF1311 family)
MRIALPVLLVITAAATPAFAQCEDKKSTAEQMECLGPALKKADADLNRIYQKTLKELPAEDAARLRKAQRAWLAYRDTHCDADQQRYSGGSIAPVVFAQCRLTLTQRRSKEIEETYTPPR